MWIKKFRPGYLGKQRDEKFAQWDKEFGEDNWRFSWIWGRRRLTFVQTCLIYEQAYYEYLYSHKNILEQLIAEASNVYDDSPTNVESGFEYTAQETNRTHIQDIAIRKVVWRLNRKFEGGQLIQIRHNKGTHQLSMTLSPGIVPFHLPQKILKPWLTGWWLPGTVECFYQSNRILEARK